MNDTRTTHTEPLTPGAVFALAAIVGAAASSARVRRLVDGDVVEGTARYLSGEGDGSRPDDVRDAFLRVTTVNGWEAWWPVAVLATEYNEGLFVIDL